MGILKHYIQTAAQLVSAYDGNIPLHLYLKQFFRQQKKYGSRDRKHISALCYYYYRLGKALPQLPPEEKLGLSLFIFSSGENDLLEAVNPTFNKHVHLSLKEKGRFAGFAISPGDLFPFSGYLSKEMDATDYAYHMLSQPDVFVRVRPGKMIVVENHLKVLGWNYVFENVNTVRLDPGVRVDKNFKVNEELVIQDLNSQHIGLIIQETFEQNHFTPQQLWDCCAASGGKSILIYDLFPGIKITVSDIRQTILQNLAKRFKEAGIRLHQSFVADLSAYRQDLPVKPTTFIIADVPCTGSGTWSRTPEQLFFFNEQLIDQYAERQFAITKNAINYLLPGGWLIYITCSVFAKENEELVEKILKAAPVHLVYKKMLDGTKIKADSMFVAIMRAK